MPAKHFIKFLLIFFVLLSFVQICYADVNEEAKKYYEEGVNFHNIGQFEKAIESFEQAITIKPDYVEAYVLLLNINFNLGRYKTVIEICNKIIRIRPDPYTYQVLGSSYGLLGQNKEAIQSFHEAIKLKPDYAHAHYILGFTYGKINDINKSIEHYLIAIKLNPNLVDAHYYIGLTYGALGKNEDAIRSYKEVIRLKSDSTDAYYGMGLSYSVLKRNNEAIESFKEVIRMQPDFANAYYMLGINYGALSQNEKAIEAYKEAIKINPDFDDVYFSLGVIYSASKQYLKAIEAFKEVIRINPENANAHYRLGLAYASLKENEKAIEAYKETLRIKPDYADAYESLIFSFSKLDQNNKITEFLEKVVKENPGVAEPHYRLGFDYFITGKLENAVKLLETALTLYKMSSDKHGEAKVALAIGEIYMNTGKDIYAINNFQKALTLYEELKDSRGVAGCFNDIAIVYFQLSDNETAIEYFQKALEIYKQLEDDVSTLRILGGITLVKGYTAKLSSGNYEETIKHGENAIEFAEKKGLTNDYNAYAAYFAVGLAYWELKDYENALKYREKILTIAQKSKMKFAIAFSSFAMAMVYNKLKNYQQASDYIQEAINQSNELDHPSLKWMLSWGRGQIAEKTGRSEEARRHYFDAISGIETIREDVQSLASKMSVGVQATNVYNDTVLFLIKTGDKDTAFNYMERAKARAFIDLLGRKSKLHTLDSNNKEILEEERQLQFKINYLLEKISEVGKEAGKKSVSYSVSLLEKELNETRVKYAELLEKIKKDYPELSSLLQVDIITLEKAQDLLDSDTTLLEYFITPEKTFLWVLNKSDLKVIEIAIKDKELKEKVDAFREKIANLKPDYGKDADELYDLLIKPAKPYIKTKRIGIAPHSILHYLPFHALLNKDKFLIEEYEMFYTPSASVLKFVYKKRKKITDKVIAFGNPDIGDVKLNLTYAEDEVKKIKDTYPDSVLYLKESATEGKVKALSGNYNIIHFASHGELNPDAPLFSSIRLAKDKDEDGRLEVNEIFNLNLKNTSLVTLSACETAMGKLTNGDELVGLTRGFIYAGTPSIVASLWRVNDQSTSELMNLFYKNLKTHPKSESLRMAQLEMIRGKTGKGIVRGVGGITTSKVSNSESKEEFQSSATVDGSHPYFWAPFILVGDWK